MKSQPIEAWQVVDLLAKHHSGDVFVAECKNGKTWGANYRRLDAWALSKSWSPWRTHGYEVKVSRSDFEHDQKWTEYLPYCHSFSFACPAGLIKAVDLPAEIGLIWVSPNGGRLTWKRKASVRKPDPDKLCQLMSYVLMSRSVIVADMHEAAKGEAPAEDTKLARVKAMREEVERAEACGCLATFVQGHVAKRDEESRHRLTRAESLMRDVEGFREQLAKLGIQWGDRGWGYNTYDVKTEIDQLGESLPRDMLQQLRCCARALTAAADSVDQLRDARDRKKAAMTALTGTGGA